MRNMLSAGTKEEVPTWDEIIKCLDAPTVRAAATIALNTKDTVGPRRFFYWVANSEKEQSISMRAFLKRQEADANSPDSVGAFRQAIMCWTDELADQKVLKSKSIRSQRAMLLALVKQLRDVDENSLPWVDPRTMRLGSDLDRVSRQSLGVLDWVEFKDIEPANRDAVGLAIVRRASVEVFERYEKIYEFGQFILAGGDGLRRDSSYDSLRGLIEDEIKCWEENRRSQFAVKWTESISERIGGLRDIGIWNRLGLSVPLNQDDLHKTAIADLVLACIGPTNRLSNAAQTIFACDTGWNAQPIQTLPLNPMAFRTESELFLGSDRMLTNFKIRAGHAVFAHLDFAEVVRGIAESNLRSAWDSTSEELKLPEYDEFVSISADCDLADVLRRYRATQSISRAWTDDKTENLYFYALSQRTHGICPANQAVGRNIKEGVLGRTGLNFSAIRKSFLNTVSTLGVEPVFVSEIASHRSPSILQTNYFVGPQAARAYEEAIRFWQSCVQELVMSDHTAFLLQIPEENREWFRTLALLTGITSACGMTDRELEGEVTDDLVFDPTHSNLLNLFLCHRALKDQRTRVPRQRWLVQGWPLLAQIKAIGRTVLRKNLGPEYLIAAREANELLDQGVLTLPLLLEI